MFADAQAPAAVIAKPQATVAKRLLPPDPELDRALDTLSMTGLEHIIRRPVSFGAAMLLFHLRYIADDFSRKEMQTMRALGEPMQELIDKGCVVVTRKGNRSAVQTIREAIIEMAAETDRRLAAWKVAEAAKINPRRSGAWGC
jgi:hypothetical protein